MPSEEAIEELRKPLHSRKFTPMHNWTWNELRAERAASASRMVVAVLCTIVDLFLTAPHAVGRWRERDRAFARAIETLEAHNADSLDDLPRE